MKPRAVLAVSLLLLQGCAIVGRHSSDPVKQSCANQAPFANSPYYGSGAGSGVLVLVDLAVHTVTQAVDDVSYARCLQQSTPRPPADDCTLSYERCTQSTMSPCVGRFCAGIDDLTPGTPQEETSGP